MQKHTLYLCLSFILLIQIKTSAQVPFKSKVLVHQKSDPYAFLDVHFENEKVAFAVAEGFIAGKEETDQTLAGMVLQTVDGGKHWTSLAAYPQLRLHALAVKNEVMVAIGHQNVTGNYTRLLLSRNKGKDWSDITPPDIKPLTGDFRISLPDTGRLYILTTRLMCSEDLGKSWNTIKVSSPGFSDGRFFDMQFCSAKEGYLLGNNGSQLYRGIIMTTKDGGNTWTGFQSSTPLFSGGAICMANTQVGYALMGGFVYKTTDAGYSWKTQQDLKMYFPAQLFFVNEMRGFISGKTGALLYTNNGGKTWKNRYLQRKGAATALAFTSLRSALVFGWGGYSYLLKLPR